MKHPSVLAIGSLALAFIVLKVVGGLIKHAILDEGQYWEPKVARVIIRIAAWLVPSRSEEWHAELDLLQGRGKTQPKDEQSHSSIDDAAVPGVTWALGVLGTAPLTGLLAWVRSLTRSESGLGFLLGQAEGARRLLCVPASQPPA